MMMIKTTLLIALGLASNVAAHGHIKTCSVNGKTYQGYNPLGWDRDTLQTVGWKDPLVTDNGFITMDNINSPDIICHKGASPGALSILVKPGDTIKCQWTDWPKGHHGSALQYLANCNGDCTKADKTSLKFNKMTEVGLIHRLESKPVGYGLDPLGITAGYWAGDMLIDHGDIFEFKVPETIAKGGYILRQEKIALHDAAPGWGTGAQPIPQCINFQVEESSGTDAFMGGTLGTELYNKNEPGFNINIWKNPDSYVCPGPPLYTGAGSGDGSAGSISGTSSASTASSTTTPYSTPTVLPSGIPSGTPTVLPSGIPSGTPQPSSSYSVPKPSLIPNQYSNKGEYSNKGGHPSAKYTDTTDSTKSSSGNYGFPDLTKLSISDLLNLIEKIVTALKSKTGMKRRHARAVTGA